MNDTNSLETSQERVAGQAVNAPDRRRTADPDADFYQDLLSGDGEKAVREFGSRLKRLVCKKYPDFRDEAEEIAFETLGRAFERIGTFRQECRFSTWISAIAYNVLRERIRLKQRQAMFEELTEEAVADYLDPEQQLLEEIEQEENRARIEEVLAGLTERQREVYKLRHTAGLTSAEIGEKLGVSAGAARSALADANAGIARWLKKKGHQ